LNSSNNTWIGQVTTGHGFMVLTPTLLAALSGSMSWTDAIPLLVAGAVGLIWPENAGLKSAAQTAAIDLEKIYTEYHNEMIAAAANAPVPPDPRKTITGLAVLAAIGMSLTACAGQTPAQQAAEAQAVTCFADTAAAVATAAGKPGSTVAIAVDATAAVGTQLTSDPACQAAIVTAPTPSAKP
jgi:hypothetical protein